MPRSSREEMQDRALDRMDKINKRRNDQQPNKPPSLAEQLAQYEKERKMPPAERLKRMDFTEWSRELREHVSKEQVTLGRIMTILERKNRKDFENFHATGTSFKEISKWIADAAMEYM